MALVVNRPLNMDETNPAHTKSWPLKYNPEKLKKKKIKTYQL